MMRVLVTVGTTSFDSLIRVLDQQSDKIEYVFQTATGKYCAKFHKSEKFINDIDSLYGKYDLIITHAGAGTVYKLLDDVIPFIVVPNTERSDKHQLELAQFVNIHSFAKVATVDDFVNKDHLEIIKDAIAFEREKYTKQEFFIKNNLICG